MKQRSRAWLPVNLAVLSLAVLSLAGPALAWDEAKAKTEVQAFMDQVAAMLIKKDLAALAATAMPQATIKYVDGRHMTMDQWRENAARDFPAMGELSSKFVVQAVWPRGKDKLGAVYAETEEYVLAADPGRKYRIDARFRVLLQRTPQGLRFLEFVELSESMTRDGKPFKPQAPPKAPAKAKPQG